MELKHMTFEQWVKKARLGPDEVSEPCSNCNGSRYTECPCCGSDIECDECGGTGRTSHAPLSIVLYRFECIREEIGYCRLFGKEIGAEVLNEYKELQKKIWEGHEEMRPVVFSIAIE